MSCHDLTTFVRARKYIVGEFDNIWEGPPECDTRDLATFVRARQYIVGAFNNIRAGPLECHVMS
jgi:hypothetical protein